MMNFKHILAALALSVPGLMAAVSADPRPRVLTNPDGTTVTVRVHGNEFFHFMTDVDCTRILERDAEGYISDAVREGRKLAFSQENVSMLAEMAKPAFPPVDTPVASMQKMAALDGSGRSLYPTIGKGNRSLIVLVEFKDVDFTIDNPKEYFTRQLNEPGFSDYGARGSALDYYLDSSNGLYAPQFDVYGPVKVSGEAAYYKDLEKMNELIAESLTALHDANELDFSNYDLDNDGKVDTIFFYYAGYGSADSETETIWPHQYDYNALVGYAADSALIFDGKKVGPYACANELYGLNPVTKKEPWKDGSEPWMNGIGTFVHEYGHVLGLPDLYDTTYSDEVETPGKYDVMDKGNYNDNNCRPPRFSAYEQWVCHWLEFTDAVDGTHYDLKAGGNSDTPGAVRIRIPMSTDGKTFNPEYFVIEARDNSNWDSCFPASGLMVWRINFNKNNWVSNTVNTQNGTNVAIVYSNSKKFPVFTGGVIYKGADVELVPSKEYPLWKSPIITAISYDKESFTGSFDYNMATPTNLFTVLHDVPVAASDGSRAFKLTWDPVEGVDSYLLTVRVANSGRVIGDFDAKDMGKETSVWVSDISSIMWRLEMEAFVTCCVDGLAATANSNVVTFKPSELALEGNAVEGIEGDSFLVSGGVGCIYAPEGAKVYDMAGKLLQKDGLAPGVYIVVLGTHTSKVLVR